MDSESLMLERRHLFKITTRMRIVVAGFLALAILELAVDISQMLISSRSDIDTSSHFWILPLLVVVSGYEHLLRAYRNLLAMHYVDTARPTGYTCRAPRAGEPDTRAGDAGDQDR